MGGGEKGQDRRKRQKGKEKESKKEGERESARGDLSLAEGKEEVFASKVPLWLQRHLVFCEQPRHDIESLQLNLRKHTAHRHRAWAVRCVCV